MTTTNWKWAALIVVLAGACSYEPAFDLTCSEEGAREGDRICTGGVWIATPGAADMDMATSPDVTTTPDTSVDAPNCVPESNAELCARLGLTCEGVTATDNCGDTRTADCGTCTGQQSCGGGGTPNVCACADQTDIEFCAANAKTCDPFTSVDACGDMRTVNCGTCEGVETCAPDNTCTCDTVAACAALNANCGMVDVTGMCAGTTMITCGSCDAQAMCDMGTNLCACNDGYTGTGVTCADIDECGTATDNCDANARCTNTPGSFTCTCNSGYMGNGTTCTPVAGLVKAVETVQITMDDDVATGTLPNPVVRANSVPFVTMRLDDTGVQGNRVAVEAYLSADDEVTIARDNTAGVVTARAYVVEFDPAFATVQSGTFSFNNTSHSETLATAVNPTKSFVVFYYQRDNGESNREDLFIVGDLNAGGTAIDFAREANSGAVDGHYWVVESVTTAFSVQHVTGTLDNIATNLPLSSVTTAKSFLLYSYSSDQAASAADRSQVNCGLTASTNVTCRRASVNDTIPDLRVQVISLTGSEFVQRGEAMIAGNTANQSITLGAAVDRTAMAFGGQIGIPGVVWHQSSTDSETPGGFFTQTLTSGGASIDLVRGNPNGDGTRVEWQVIDW